MMRVVKPLSSRQKNVTREINIGEFEKICFKSELKFKVKSHILKVRLFVRKSFWTSVVNRPNLWNTFQHSHGQSLIVYLTFSQNLKVKPVAYLQNRILN